MYCVHRSILVQRLKLSTLPKAVKTHFEQVGEVLIADVLRRPSGKSLGNFQLQQMLVRVLVLEILGLDRRGFAKGLYSPASNRPSKPTPQHGIRLVCALCSNAYRA
mmetsp:Transcript_19289/g.77203  ORF Transcript_19289/g.77203 Transcript_19289/m.77203 type:complete len:106 (-) Transcript_19289:670-987(-)